MSEEVGKTKSKQQAKAHWFCRACGNEFWGAKNKPKCPKCHETVELMELTEDGIPKEDVRRIIESKQLRQAIAPEVPVEEKSRPGLTLDISRDALLKADEMSAEMFEREVDESIREHIASSIKAKALKSKADLLEQERRLSALQGGGEEAENVSFPAGYNQPLAQSNPMIGPLLLQGISSLDEEAQKRFFEMVKDPQAAYGLATIMATVLNPPKPHLQAFYNPYMNNNPISQLFQGMGQMAAPAQPVQQEGEGQAEGGVKDMAETVKILVETMQAMQPQKDEGVNTELKEVLTEIKRGQEELRDKYYELQLAQLEGRGGGGGEGLSKEDLEEIIEKRLQSLNKTPKDALKEIKDTILAVDELRETIAGEAPEQQEPLETWIKKHTLQREAEEEQRRHEKEIKELEAKAAKWSTAKMLLQEGIRENLLKMGRKKEEPEEEPTVEPELRDKKVQLVK